MTAAPSTVERAREAYEYLTEVVEFWATRDHDWCNGSCSACRQFYGDLDAASIALDVATAEAHPAPDWREFQDLIWLGRLEETLRKEVAWA